MDYFLIATIWSRLGLFHEAHLLPALPNFREQIRGIAADFFRRAIGFEDIFQPLLHACFVTH